MPSNITTGMRYTKEGMVCITSRTGVIIFWTRSLRDIQIPIGIPIAMHKRVATDTIAKVAIVSSHISIQPIARNAKMAPKDIFQLRDPTHESAPIIKRIIGHGVATNKS